MILKVAFSFGCALGVAQEHPADERPNQKEA
jgi:hypothetical protein